MMKRRQFISRSTTGLVGGSLILPFTGCVTNKNLVSNQRSNKAPKNIIFLVSDGMSHGTLNMSDIFLQRKNGVGSNWINLYREKKVSRGFMDMSSASSSITDSAAASSSWGGGHRVPNGRLNVDIDGKEHTPILQKFKAANKKVGCVTTVPITHATPAGFCVSSKSRGEQSEIAEKYLQLRFDVMMGGGSKYFNKRKDDRDLFEEFKIAGYGVARTTKEMNQLDHTKPNLCVFDNDGLPYELDRINNMEALAQVPSLASMTQKAIDLMKGHKEGFVLQVEGGKVDWASHANDIFALIHDQVAFDQAIKVAIDFAAQDGDTLVILTTDHGNSNPGLYYGKNSDKNFEKIFTAKSTNHNILQKITKNSSVSSIREMFSEYQGIEISQEEGNLLLSKYQELEFEDGLYNDYKLPYTELAQIQRKYTSTHFGGTEHTADYSEIAMFGPGSELLPQFMINTDLHYFMLEVTEVSLK